MFYISLSMELPVEISLQLFDNLTGATEILDAVDIPEESTFPISLLDVTSPQKNSRKRSPGYKHNPT